MLPLERKVGAVVFAREGEDVYVALVHDVFGHWTLPKGGIEEGLAEEVGVVREIKEEIGLDITVKEKLGENEYVATTPDEGKKARHLFPCRI
jgi:8-oxo-dGTP pyrophosphatase MutT (NUDIX family)